jgi:uncharacterized protein
VQADATAGTVPAIREEVLRDQRFPVHKIADTLLPYLQVLVQQFRPEQVILFGSYALGQPHAQSDVDLIIVKELRQSRVKEATAILKAWRPLRWQGKLLPFELLIETPAGHAIRAAKPRTFYAEAVRTGLRLA